MGKALFCAVTLISAPLLWASEKNEFQIIPESVHFYKGHVKTIDSPPRDVEVERFVASRMEVTKKIFVSLIISFDPMSGLSFWESISSVDGREPELSDLQGNLFDMESYLANRNIYISNIGIVSLKIYNDGESIIRGFSGRFKTLDDARDSMLSKLRQMTLTEINQSDYKNISLRRLMPYSFFHGSQLCAICMFHAKVTGVRVVGDKWLISISGGYQTDAELVLDRSYNITKICIHPAEDHKNEKPN